MNSSARIYFASACALWCAAYLQIGATAALENIPAPSPLTNEELAAGWISLFDGESLYGWQPGSKADWKVEDGAIVVTSGEQGILATTTEFSDFELKLEFRAPRNSNSGFLRTPLEPKDPTKDCYEVNIAHRDNPFPSGSLVGRKKGDPLDEKESDEKNGWRSIAIIADGGRFRASLDGREILDYTDEHPLRRGKIGLQRNEGPVAFRNIKLRPLGMKVIFNGKDLSGWKTDLARASKLSVSERGELTLKNGPGQIESEGRYGDFVLQLELFSNGRGLNSGVFFRSMPGLYQQGYESQIQNGFKGDDRNQPTDAGTGGIYRRQIARRVMADDFTWFPKTIVADGPHMAVWVNGVQVSDWIDERPPDENPRQGLRLKAGTIILQGHDPTTDLRFRNLRIVEMPSRL